MPTVIVRSQDRHTGTAKDFVVRAQQLLPPCTLRLKHVTMPAAVYTFSTRNRAFRFSFNGSTQTIKLPVGFYDATSAAAALNAEVNAGIGAGAIQLTFDSTRGRIRVDCPSQFIVRGDDEVANSCMQDFGFTKQAVFESGGWAPALLDLTRKSFAYHVVINDSGDIVNLSTGGHTSFYIVNSEVDSLQYFKFDQRNFGQTVRLHRPSRNLHIQLFDGEYEPLWLQAGAEWEMVLEY